MHFGCILFVVVWAPNVINQIAVPFDIAVVLSVCMVFSFAAPRLWNINHLEYYDSNFIVHLTILIDVGASYYLVSCLLTMLTATCHRVGQDLRIDPTVEAEIERCIRQVYRHFEKNTASIRCWSSEQWTAFIQWIQVIQFRAGFHRTVIVLRKADRTI